MTESAGRARLITEQVRAAYREGFRRGLCIGASDEVCSEDQAWRKSAAAEALAGQEEAPQFLSGSNNSGPTTICPACCLDDPRIRLCVTHRQASATVEEAAENLRKLIKSEAGHIAYVDDLIDELIAAKAEEDAPAPPRYPEESLATHILQEQKDLEAHTRAVTDVDRLVQIRDSILKEPQP